MSILGLSNEQVVINNYLYNKNKRKRKKKKPDPNKRYEKTVALILCALGFLGFAGGHRQYLDQPTLAKIYFFTFGFFFIGTTLDFILILTNRYRDRNGRPLI